MGSNIAMRRAAKANRRKAIVAQKRKSEMLAGTLPERVRRAAGAPIRHCLLQENLFDMGLGTLVLARGATPDHLKVGVFLVDVYCLGIKDAYFRSVDARDFEMFVATMEATGPLVHVDPSEARKLLREVAVWAKSIGFDPARDFAPVEQLFGDVSADASDATFRFGCDGKPFYVQGPTDSPAQVLRRLAQVQAYLRGKAA